MASSIKMYRGDCLRFMERVPDNYFDLIITDPPYGNTQQEFDVPLDMEAFCAQAMRIIKPGRAVILFCMQPFTTDVMNANRKYYRQELIMHKSHAQGFLSAPKRPLSAHENVLVFSKDKAPYYVPEFTEGKPYRVEYNRNYSMSNYGKEECGRKGKILENEGTRYPRSVFEVSNPNMLMMHPHGKALSFIRKLVRLYSDPGDLVFDACMGGGSTPAACYVEGRNFKGCELTKKWFNFSVERVQNQGGKVKTFKVKSDF